jgi:hypothetical protein
MADPQLPDLPNPNDIAVAIFAEWLTPQNATKFTKIVQNAVEEAIKTAVSGALNMGGPIALSIARGIIEGEGQAQEVMDQLAALGIEDLLDVKVSRAGLSRRGNAGGRKGIGNAIGDAILKSVTGTTGQLQPSAEGAKVFLGKMASFAIEGWLEGWIVELLSSLIPGVGNIETFAELDDIMSSVMGFGRLSRRVLSPLIDATVVTPMEWQTLKTYRPKLLAAAEAVRQFTRGRWTREQLEEELARQGYSADRIDALVNAQRHFFSPSDVRAFVASEHWTRDQGLQHLKDQGYTPDDAENALRLEGIKRIAQLEDEEARAIVAAYVDRALDPATFAGLLRDAVSNDAERHLITEAAELRRTLNGRRVSLSQGEQFVKSGVWSVRDYRQLCEDYGYPPDDVLALELQLRWELDKEKAIADQRAELDAQRAADKAAKDAAAAARKAAVDAERAAARRGPLGDLERAYVRGLIPIARVEELLAHDYDADTVGILVALLEDDRQTYLARQQAAADVEQRGTLRRIDVGDLKTATLAGVLTLAEFGQALTGRGFDAGDVAILVDTMRVRLEDQAAAEQRRREADTAAAKRSIDLGQFEQLVRRGLRTMSQYADLLASLDFDDGAIAGLVDLLNAKIAEDAAARDARLAGEAALRPKGLSLEQARRAVLLSVQSADWFQAFLQEQNFTVDAQVVLMAELRADLAEAEAARARRTLPAPAPKPRRVPLTTVRRAAQLGLISPATYEARLLEDGFAEEDVALDLELLLLEIADVQATRAKRDAAEAAGAARGLSLADVARAVKAGVASIEAYRARAVELGYSLEDAGTLVDVLETELAALADARARRDQVGAELTARNLSLAQLEEAVKKGFQSIDWYAGELVGLGYGADDVELLVALLDDELTTAAGATEAG